MSKIVKIFLASSIDDLRYDRLEVGDFFRQLNEIYLASDIHFSLIKCEDYDNAIAASGKQSQYDEEIKNSDLVFFLFFRKVGEYTKHEFEVALEEFKRTNDKPKIITYFKYVDSINEANDEIKAFMALLDGELRHYYNTYGNIDTLKLGMLMQIKIMKLDSSKVKIEDGDIKLNGQTVAKAKNVPYLAGNKDLMDLTDRKKELQEQFSKARATYLTDPSEENEKLFLETSAELDAVSKQLTEIEKNALELMTTVAEITSDGRVLTHRQKEALKFFSIGDYASAKAILEDKERENELARAENRAEMSLNEIAGYIQEERLWIHMTDTRHKTGEKTRMILEKYKKLEKLIEKYGIEIDTYFDYAYFLYFRNQYNEAIEISKRAIWYFSRPGVDDMEDMIADQYDLLAQSYEYLEIYDESEKFFKKGIESYEDLNCKYSGAYSDELADMYTNLGNLYKDKLERFDLAKDVYEKAIQLYQDKVLSDSEEDIHFRAHTYWNLASVYRSCRKYDESEEMIKKSVEEYLKLLKKYEDAPVVLKNSIQNVIDANNEMLDFYRQHKEELKQLTEMFAE